MVLARGTWRPNPNAIEDANETRVWTGPFWGAQGFMSPHHWLQGAKPGPAPPVLQAGGKYVGQ